MANLLLTSHLKAFCILHFDLTLKKTFYRKLKRIVRSPQYDNNFINGDMALLQLEKKVSATLCTMLSWKRNSGLISSPLLKESSKLECVILMARPCNLLMQVEFSDTILNIWHGILPVQSILVFATNKVNKFR